jgi:hypothetical protein
MRAWEEGREFHRSELSSQTSRTAGSKSPTALWDGGCHPFAPKHLNIIHHLPCLPPHTRPPPAHKLALCPGPLCPSARAAAAGPARSGSARRRGHVAAAPPCLAALARGLPHALGRGHGAAVRWGGAGRGGPMSSASAASPAPSPAAPAFVPPVLAPPALSRRAARNMALAPVQVPAGGSSARAGAPPAAVPPRHHGMRGGRRWACEARARAGPATDGRQTSARSWRRPSFFLTPSIPRAAATASACDGVGSPTAPPPLLPAAALHPQGPHCPPMSHATTGGRHHPGGPAGLRVGRRAACHAARRGRRGRGARGRGGLGGGRGDGRRGRCAAPQARA